MKQFFNYFTSKKAEKRDKIMKRYFTYKDEKSDKFWSVEIQNNEVTTIFGKIGTAGSSNIKVFGDAETANKEANKLIKEKIKKGYTEIYDLQIMKFGENEFWSLIERAKSKAEDTNNQIEILTELLASRTNEDIIEFGNIFWQLQHKSYQSDLWAAAYIINGGCSDDGFEYFRGWLIAQGKDIFYNTMKDPQYLTRILKENEIGEVECEDMLSVAGDAYINKTGKSYDDFMAQITMPSYQDIDLAWEEDDLEKKYPRLWKKCNYD